MSEARTTPPSRRRGPGLLVLILVCLLLGFAAAAYHPAVRAALGGWSPAGIRDLLLSFGPWAWAFSAFLMIVQAIVSPLPAFVITIANGYVFGWFWGGVLALLSATLAAQICFEVARALGRPAVERWVDARVLRWADGFFQRHGVWAVLIARLLPFVPFDPISYAAGVTTTTRTRFLAANLVGQVPATFVYSTLGSEMVDGRLPPLVVILLASAAGLVALFILIRTMLGRQGAFPDDAGSGKDAP